MKTISFKKALEDVEKESVIKEYKYHVTAFFAFSDKKKVTYNFEKIIPFFYKCSYYRCCKCVKDNHREIFLACRPNIIEDEFPINSSVTIEENKKEIYFYWLKDNKRYKYPIENGTKCMFPDNSNKFCTNNIRVISLIYKYKDRGHPFNEI